MNGIIEKSFHNSFVNGLCKLFDAIVQIVTLGYCYSSLAMTHTEWQVRRRIRKMKR